MSSKYARQWSQTDYLVDLSGVTFIDDAGQECLAAMHRRGVEFIASDALTKDIVAEITQATISDSGPTT